MAGKMGGKLLVAAKQSGVFSRLKRGAIITTAGMVVCGVASLFVPFVPIVWGVIAGGIGGGAIANATAKKQP